MVWLSAYHFFTEGKKKKNDTVIIFGNINIPIKLCFVGYSTDDYERALTVSVQLSYFNLT